MTRGTWRILSACLDSGGSHGSMCALYHEPSTLSAPITAQAYVREDGWVGWLGDDARDDRVQPTRRAAALARSSARVPYWRGALRSSEKSFRGALRHGCQRHGVAGLAPLDYVDAAAVPIFDELGAERILSTAAVSHDKVFQPFQGVRIHHQGTLTLAHNEHDTSLCNVDTTLERVPFRLNPVGRYGMPHRNRQLVDARDSWADAFRSAGCRHPPTPLAVVGSRRNPDRA